MTRMLSTKTQVQVFFIFLSILLLFIGQYFWGRSGLVLFFIFAVALNTAVFFFGESQILKRLQAKQLKGQDPWGINALIAEICFKNQYRQPHIFLIENENPVLFSIGVNTRSGIIGISSGLIEKFTPQELKVLLTRQIIQLEHSSSFALSAMSTLVQTLIYTSEILDAFLPLQLLTKRNLRFFQIIVSPFAWLLLRLVVRQKQFLEVDQQTGEIVQNRQLLGELIWKLNHLAYSRPFATPNFTSHLFVVEPNDLNRSKKIWSFHPPITLRLKNLIGNTKP